MRNFLLLVAMGLVSSLAVYADEISDLQTAVKEDNFSPSTLTTWKNILNGSLYPELRVQAPHAVLKIQPSRLQARHLAQVYSKEKDNKELRLAILNELVRTKTVTVLDGWQNEIMSPEISYSDRLRLNFLSLREGAIRKLYKEGSAVGARDCEFDKSKLKLELRRKDGEPQNYFWLKSGFHIHYTGIETLEPQVPECSDIEFLNLTALHAGLFWEKAGAHLITVERRYFRPLLHLDFKNREEFSKVSQKQGDKTCFLPQLQEQFPLVKKAWLCIR